MGKALEENYGSRKDAKEQGMAERRFPQSRQRSGGMLMEIKLRLIAFTDGSRKDAIV